MSELSNKTISSIKRSLRSFSNSPMRSPQHITGELGGKASPAQARKSRKPAKAKKEVQISADMQEVSITDGNNNAQSAKPSATSKMPTNIQPKCVSAKANQHSNESSDDSDTDSDFGVAEKNSKTANKPRSKSAVTKPKKEAAKKCGLCDTKRKKMTTTKCCGNVICDDLGKYRPFSFGLDSCYRNHDRYTLCAFHFVEGSSRIGFI